MIRKHYTLDKLEDEIYRLHAEGKNIREKLNNNFEYLESHYASLVMSSVLDKVLNGKEKMKEKIINSIWAKHWLTKK